MASNSTLALDDGKSRLLANISGFPMSASDRQSVASQPVARAEVAHSSDIQREGGDQVNRFLLCVLVSESAKRIKSSAANAGEALPMTMIVRGVLRSYRVAAKDKYGPLAGPELDMVGIRALNEKVLNDELARHSNDRVKISQTRLAHAERLHDDTKIKAEKDGLEYAIELRDRLVSKYR